MRKKIWLKLTGSFALLILSGSIIIAVIINITITNFYANFVNKNDLNLAGELSVQIGSYFENSGSWDGIYELIKKITYK